VRLPERFNVIINVSLIHFFALESFSMSSKGRKKRSTCLWNFAANYRQRKSFFSRSFMIRSGFNNSRFTFVTPIYRNLIMQKSLFKRSLWTSRYVISHVVETRSRSWVATIYTVFMKIDGRCTCVTPSYLLQSVTCAFT